MTILNSKSFSLPKLLVPMLQDSSTRNTISAFTLPHTNKETHNSFTLYRLTLCIQCSKISILLKGISHIMGNQLLTVEFCGIFLHRCKVDNVMPVRNRFCFKFHTQMGHLQVQKGKTMKAASACFILRVTERVGKGHGN